MHSWALSEAGPPLSGLGPRRAGVRGREAADWRAGSPLDVEAELERGWPLSLEASLRGSWAISVQALRDRSLSGPKDTGVGHGSGPAWRPARGQLSSSGASRPAECWLYSGVVATSLAFQHWVGLLFTPGVTLHTFKKDKEIFAKDII